MTIIKIAQKDQKKIIKNLMQLYLHDLSEFIDLEMDSQGRFLNDEYFDFYWIEPERHPYLIIHQGNIAGFTLVRNLEPDTWSAAEFFILRSFRKKGIGKSAAIHLFSLHSGTWHIAQLEANTPAQSFWRKVIQSFTKGKYDTIWSDDSPIGPMLVFDTNLKTGKPNKCIHRNFPAASGGSAGRMR